MLTVEHTTEGKYATKRRKIKENGTSNENLQDENEEEEEETSVRKLLVEQVTCCVCYTLYGHRPCQCIKGHVICNFCFWQLKEKKCPMCRDIYYDEKGNPLKNANGYTLVSEFVKESTCAWKEEGCTFHGTFKMKEIHEQCCSYTLLKCFIDPSQKCTWCGHLKYYVKHLTDQHNLNTIEYDQKAQAFEYRFKRNKKNNCLLALDMFRIAEPPMQILVAQERVDGHILLSFVHLNPLEATTCFVTLHMNTQDEHRQNISTTTRHIPSLYKFMSTEDGFRDWKGGTETSMHIHKDMLECFSQTKTSSSPHSGDKDKYFQVRFLVGVDVIVHDKELHAQGPLIHPVHAYYGSQGTSLSNNMKKQENTKVLAAPTNASLRNRTHNANEELHIFTERSRRPPRSIRIVPNTLRFRSGTTQNEYDVEDIVFNELEDDDTHIIEVKELEAEAEAEDEAEAEAEVEDGEGDSQDEQEEEEEEAQDEFNRRPVRRRRPLPRRSSSPDHLQRFSI